MIQKHYENFLTTLYRFIQDLDRYKQTDGTKQVLEIYNKLDMAKVIFRVYTLLKQNGSKINSRDETLFNTDLEILPNINVSVCWPDLVSGRKQKVWTYLSILQIESDILVNSKREQLITTATTTSTTLTTSTTTNTLTTTNTETDTSTKKKEPLVFDPYVGIGGETNDDYGVEEMYASLANMPDEGSSGPGLASIASLIGLDKMVNFEELSDQLRNMKPEDIENATNNIKEMLGNNMDEGTSAMISGMLTDISFEMKSTDLGGGGDPFKNIMSVAEKVAGNMKPKIQSGELDIGKLVNSTQMFAAQCKDKDGNPMFAEGNNPFSMLSKLAASMGGNANANTQGDQEKQMMDQCNSLLQSMGMNGNVEQLMKNAQPAPKTSGKKKKGGKGGKGGKKITKK